VPTATARNPTVRNAARRSKPYPSTLAMSLAISTSSRAMIVSASAV
jgi:hypothetical protein